MPSEFRVTEISTRQEDESEFITHIWCGDQHWDAASAAFAIKHEVVFYTDVDGSTAIVEPVERDSRTYLRTRKNGILGDNLLSLPRREAPFSSQGP
ncbi:MAG TPA: DUF3892 domain-containing protein [Polyangiaceae bacterium]|jgi:hypothetical protein|nr:DUF3892 domain-containing protein [Polyangiaceae bacterium]